MSIKKILRPFPWAHYSRKLAQAIERPQCVGFFTKEESLERGMFLAVGRQGREVEGYALSLFWLVDPEDGSIVDARFQCFGQTALLGAAEVASLLVIGKNYDQARRISADLIDKQVRDSSLVPAFPRESDAFLNIVLSTIDEAAERCLDISLPESYVAPPVALQSLEPGEPYPGWNEMTSLQQLALIEEVLDADVRPYIELDAGGVLLKEIHQGLELKIAYLGSCVGCFSSTGATLSYIQQILRAKVHPNITVIPVL